MISKSVWYRAGLVAALVAGVALLGCKGKDEGKKAGDEASKSSAEEPAKTTATESPPAPPTDQPEKPAADENAEPAQAEGMPSGAEVLDRYAEVTGGKAHAKVENRVIEATISMPKLGIEGKTTIYQAKPARMYALSEIAGIGTIEQGFDGEVAWEKTQMMGVRVLEYDERDEIIAQAMPDADLAWRKLYKDAVTVGMEEVDGKPAYKVVVTRNSGSRKTAWFDKESGLMVKTAMTIKSAMGEIPSVARFLDYRDVDGMTFPFKNEGEMLGNAQNVTMLKLEHNVKLPANRFDLPDDVAAVVKAKKEASDPGKAAAPAQPGGEKAPK